MVFSVGCAAVVFVALTLVLRSQMRRIAGCRACPLVAHPVAINFFGTPIIALLLLSAVAAPYSGCADSSPLAAGAVSMNPGFAWLILSRWMSVRQQVVHAYARLDAFPSSGSSTSLSRVSCWTCRARMRSAPSGWPWACSSRFRFSR